ncbi:unnamed protein product [Acanthoscelides obtectus]|uniref:Cytosol aminopeptidase domain-containing protein n=1 Tax=Acanthoscelides obtectus TaxID=200917 RepID=A0A9P0K5W6_ACAOB|nr:unnamed protein product [Acanthoscelides obtectus]CAK1648079.1 Putative aminopeptidase W07G4.4 [Acanthoscelides obtectus]
MARQQKTLLKAASWTEREDYDGLVLVSAPDQAKSQKVLHDAVSEALTYDAALTSELAVLPLRDLNTRLVHSPTGPIDSDYGDVRLFKKAAADGIKRALKSGMKAPLLVLEEHSRFPRAELVTLLGALEALYVPIQVRESDPSKVQKIDRIGVLTSCKQKTEKLVQLADVLESGRRVACDIGDADPERMAPQRVEEYVRKVFADGTIKLDVLSDLQHLTKEFPLFEAVNRAASVVERHRGRVIFLEYDPKDNVTETLFLVGKGVTYDTGGADVKISGCMIGMSRDKCGAAAAAGFMEMVRRLQPKNIRVVAAMSMVRNSIGSNSYVADEVITARSGKRVRVVNTDAEGRMVMADLLCKFKEDALKAVNPHLFTIATLTGHAYLTVGDGYAIVMDNGPAKKSNYGCQLQKASEDIGDPFEISNVRKEDFDTYKGKMEGDDIIQATPRPSSQTARGHQGPAAFLIVASGLDAHGSGSESPIKYSHLDIAASAGGLPKPATGSPVLAFAEKYLLKDL